VTDPSGPDYVSEHDYDVPPQIIEYDPSELPFMQEDSIEMFLPWTNEYKEKLVKYHGKEPGSIQILKKEDEKHEETIKEMVNIEPRSYPYTESTPASISMKEVLCSCGTRERASPSMPRKMTVHVLALTLLRRSPIKKSII
jgi:hypothetical protein